MSLRKNVKPLLPPFPFSNRKTSTHAQSILRFQGLSRFVLITCQGRNANSISSFLLQQTRWSSGRFIYISQFPSKDSFVQKFSAVSMVCSSLKLIGQLNQIKVPPHRKSIQGHLLTTPRFGALNHESESTGIKPVQRKLFPLSPHSFLTISRPTPLDSLSALLCFLGIVHSGSTSSRLIWIF